MTLEELRALFSDMLSKDMHPMLCDTEVPKYEAKVPCGNPNYCPDDIVETELLPRKLLSMHPEFMIRVIGDSMKDAGIVAGDLVKVEADVTPYDGDIVLASIDGEYTLKTYYEDEDGRKWLVPQNEKYTPILLDGNKLVKIFGRVKEIVKTAPRVASRLCANAVRKVKMAMKETHEISQQQVGHAIREIAPYVTIARLWYAVYRIMADHNVVEEEDFDTFINKVEAEVPQHEHLPSKTELQRLAVQSFAKPVTKWSPDNAPVKGSRYKLYVMIANKTEELLMKKK